MRAGEVIRCPTVEYLLEREIVQPDVADRQSGGELCFRARDMTTGSRVRLALWSAAPDAVIARGRARAQLLASLDAPGLERLLQFGATIAGAGAPPVPFVATEWVQGESLEERLPRGGLGYDDAIRLGAAIARALEQAHGKGLVHGAIGPSTVVLPARGDGAAAIKIVGFVSAAMGTGGYAPPERASTPGEALDPRMDFYALGAILFRIVSGRPPSSQPEPSGTQPMQSQRSVPLASLAPLAPDALCKLVDACLSPDPAARPASAGEIAARLDALQPTVGASLPPRSNPAPATMIARQSGAPPSRPRSSGPVTERSNVSIAIVATAFGVLGVAGVVALVALRSAKNTSIPDPSGGPVASAQSSAPPEPSAAATSSAPILVTVPLPRPSAPAARFSCGLSFYCSAETQYCLVATDRETNFSCVKAPKCPGRPECDCVTVEYDSCERIGGGLMVRRSTGKKPPRDGEEEEE